MLGAVRASAGAVPAGPRRRTGLVDGLTAVDWAKTTQDVALRLAQLTATAYRDREPDPQRLDLGGRLQPDRLQQPLMVGYAAYADRFAGDLAGVERPIPYLQELGVTSLHEVMEIHDWGVPGTLRRHHVGPMNGLYNVTESWRSWPAARVAQLGLDRSSDAISSRIVEPDGDGNFWLPPYAAWWLVEQH